MLVIRRRPGEAVVIGDGIEVEILESSAGRVKLGIRAPREITVMRKEVQDTREHNRSAAREIPLELLNPVLRRLGS
jgi:carbon storage regulator